MLTDLGTLGGLRSNALGINREGKAVGWAQTASGATRAALWQNGTVKNLGTLGGNRSVATAISPLGVVVGYSRMKDGSYHAFVWANGVMTDLGQGLAQGINRSGWVVGVREAPGGSRATLWRPNQN